MSVAPDFRKQWWKGQRRPQKYNAVRVDDPDHGAFDSKHEHKEYHKLLQRLRAGEIRNLQRQVTYQLNVNGEHVCDVKLDFTYEERAGDALYASGNGPNIAPRWEHIDHDAKGVLTPVAKVKYALFEAIFGRKIRLS